MGLGIAVYGSTSGVADGGLGDFLSNSGGRISGLHFDSIGDFGVLRQAKQLRGLSHLPFELHTVGPLQPALLREAEKSGFTQVMVQAESWPPDNSPENFTSLEVGVAVRPDSVDTATDLLDTADYLCVMASEPGVGGRPFSPDALQAVRKLRARFPGKELVIDGGVREALIEPLIDAGVNRVIVGSALQAAIESLNGKAALSFGSGVLSLPVQKLAVPLHQTPFILRENSVGAYLQTLDWAKAGFVVLVDKAGCVEGLISDGDVRRALARLIEHGDEINDSFLINSDPMTIESSATVSDLAAKLARHGFPRLNGVPVVDDGRRLVGHIPREVIDRF